MAIPYIPETHGDIDAVAAKPPEPVKTEQQIANPFPIDNKTYHGQDAIAMVAQREGDLSPVMKRVIEEEGFVNGVYTDTKGIETSGVGQTGEYMDRTFKESFKDHEDTASRLLPSYSEYPEYLQAEIMSAAYRGDLQQSPTFRKLMKEGKYLEAADEFLNHKEYLDLNTPRGIRKRLERIADAVRQFGMEQQEAPKGEALDGTQFVRDESGRMLRVVGDKIYDARTGARLDSAAGPDAGPDVGTIENAMSEVRTIEGDVQDNLAGFGNATAGEIKEGVKELVGANLYKNTSEALAEGDTTGAALEVGFEALGPLGDWAKSMFIGAKSVKAGAELLNRESGESIYERFIKAEQDGADMEQIRKNLGWFRDTDGSLQFEIDDSVSKYVGDSIPKIEFKDGKELQQKGITGLYENAKYRLPSVLDHPTLYDQYPELLNLRIGFFKNTGDYTSAGGYATRDGKLIGISENALNNPEELRKTILHEVQHIIQGKEGWTGGNSINNIRMSLLADNPKLKIDMEGELKQAWDKLPADTWAAQYTDGVHLALQQASLLGKEKGTKYIKRVLIDKGIPIPPNINLDVLWDGSIGDDYAGRIARNALMIRNSFKSEEAFEEWMKLQTKAMKKVEAYDLESKSRYYSTLGEVNSRNVETRADFSEETRREVSPMTTKDVPEKLVLDRDGNRIWQAK